MIGLSRVYLYIFFQVFLQVTVLEGRVTRHQNSAQLLGTEGKPRELWREVDVFIGTGEHGHTFPGATTPWGMVQATPWIHSKDSKYAWDTQSGYHARLPSPKFFGMAHTALSGAGTGELGELRLLPSDLGPDSTLVLEQGLTEASPGYFATTVRKGNPKGDLSSPIRIKSSATPHGAIHEFSFNASTAERKVSVMVSPVPEAFYGQKLRNYWHQAVSKKRYEGCAESLSIGFGNAVSLLCFVIEFDQAFLPLSKKDLGPADVTFDFSRHSTFQVSSLTARVSVSRTSIAKARVAFNEEVAGKKFDDVLRAARQSWDTALGVIQVDVAPPSRKKMFYSALYHTLLAPNLLSDSDGSYRLQNASPDQPFHNPGMAFGELDERMPVRQSRGHSQYGTFSLWDTYRSLHPLMNLVQPEKSRDFAQSLLAFADAWKFLPGFELLASTSDMMGGDGGSVVLSQMAMQGLVDKKQAFEVLNRTRREPVDERKYLNDKKEIGQFDLNVDQFVSKALEQGMADSCVSRVAHSLNLTNEEKYFLGRAQSVRRYWDHTNRVYSPSALHQSFLGQGGLSQENLMHAYAEGTPLQYSWGAQYDIQWQLKQRGSVKEYICALDYFFEDAPEPRGGDKDVSGNIHGASLGNEPSMHTPYLYSLVGYPSRTQDVIDKAVKRLFSDKPNGLPGNDDMGQMSSWLVFSMLGFYPVDPCSNDFVLGRPFIGNANMSVQGNVLQIIVHDQADENKYVRRVQWQGQPLDLTRPVLSFDALSKGGVLEFWMGKRSSGPSFKCSSSSNSASPSLLQTNNVRLIIGEMVRSLRDGINSLVNSF